MLRRLGLVKEVNGENGHSSEEAAASADASRAQTHVTAPSVDPHLNSRYFKVVYRGAVAVRSNPAEPAPEVGQVSKRINTHITGTDRQHSSSHIILQLLRTTAVCIYIIGGEITGRSWVIGRRHWSSLRKVDPASIALLIPSIRCSGVRACALLYLTLVAGVLDNCLPLRGLVWLISCS